MSRQNDSDKSEVVAVLLLPATGTVQECCKHRQPAPCCGEYTYREVETHDPHGLLRGGPCGATPPSWIADFEPVIYLSKGPYPETMWRCPGCRESEHGTWPKDRVIERLVHAWWCRYRALVLGWDAKLVVEGLDRAKRRGVVWDDTPRRVRAYLAGDYGAAHIIDPAHGIRVILLGHDRHEVVRVHHDGVGTQIVSAREVPA